MVFALRTTSETSRSLGQDQSLRNELRFASAGVPVTPVGNCSVWSGGEGPYYEMANVFSWTFVINLILFKIDCHWGRYLLLAARVPPDSQRAQVGDRP